MAKILVIEDEQKIRLRILEILMYEGFETISAADGRLGIQLAKEHLPDLILCDIVLPELDGYEVLAELRHDPLTGTIPFIFLTAKTTMNDVRKGKELGADDYLTKPFTIDGLLVSINTQLKKHAAASEHISEQTRDIL